MAIIPTSIRRVAWKYPNVGETFSPRVYVHPSPLESYRMISMMIILPKRVDFILPSRYYPQREILPGLFFLFFFLVFGEPVQSGEIENVNLSSGRRLSGSYRLQRRLYKLADITISFSPPRYYYVKLDKSLSSPRQNASHSGRSRRFIKSVSSSRSHGQRLPAGIDRPEVE